MSERIEGLLRRLEAWVQEEVGAQRRMLALLEEQERALASGDAAALEESGARVERELRRAAPREARRRECVAGLAEEWGVAAGALTLGSVAERVGAGAARLVELREELRSAAADVLRRGRRIAALARYHRGLLEEVVQVLGGEGGRPRAEADAGRVVDVGA